MFKSVRKISEFLKTKLRDQLQKFKSYLNQTHESFRDAKEIIEWITTMGNLKKVSFVLVFIRLNSIIFVIQLSVNAFLCRQEFLKFAFHLVLASVCIYLLSFESSMIIKPDKVAKLLHWCEIQADNEAVQLLDGWPRKLQQKNYQALMLTKTWRAFIIFFCSVVPLSSVIVSLICGKFWLVMPAYVTLEDSLTVWTYLAFVMQQTVFFIHVCSPISNLYLMLYNSVLFLHFRCVTIVELVKKLGLQVMDTRNELDQSLIKNIVDLQTDVME